MSTSTSSTLPNPLQDALPIDQAATARPDAHTQRYDRQLRLWASSGQSALEKARVLVVGGNATATQTLKNLVLPGIGHFTLTSPVASTTPSDLGTNFFLSHSSLSNPLAPSAVSRLLELNTDVSGTPLVCAPSEITQENVADHSLVLLVDVTPPEEARRIADLAWENKVPVLKVQSAGFFGSVRAQVEELCIVETHPESLVDLRVQAPFPALLEYAASFDYAKLDSEQHNHIPAVVILVKALEEWKDSHNGSLPSGTPERKQFTDLILSQKIQSDEENFDEAVTLYRRAGVGSRPNVPREVEALFEDEACEGVSKDSSSFWLLLHAVRTFVRSNLSNPNRLLPLSGALPDMKASSSSYVALRNLYKQKAREDRDEIARLVTELEDRLGLGTMQGGGGEGGRGRIGEEDIETFVKHAAWVRVVRGRRISEEESEEGCRLKGKIGSLLSSASFQQPPDISLYIYTALRAADRFYSSHSRYPGQSDDQDLEADACELEELAKGLLLAWKGDEDWSMFGVEEREVWSKLGEVVREIVRAPPTTTLPQTSALLGGLVAQEAIKLVTKQYIPLGLAMGETRGERVGGETVVWDGVRSGTGLVDA